MSKTNFTVEEMIERVGKENFDEQVEFHMDRRGCTKEEAIDFVTSRRVGMVEARIPTNCLIKALIELNRLGIIANHSVDLRIGVPNQHRLVFAEILGKVVKDKGGTVLENLPTSARKESITIH